MAKRRYQQPYKRRYRKRQYKRRRNLYGMPNSWYSPSIGVTAPGKGFASKLTKAALGSEFASAVAQHPGMFAKHAGAWAARGALRGAARVAFGPEALALESMLAWHKYKLKHGIYDTPEDAELSREKHNRQALPQSDERGKYWSKRMRLRHIPPSQWTPAERRYMKYGERRHRRRGGPKRTYTDKYSGGSGGQNSHYVIVD